MNRTLGILLCACLTGCTDLGTPSDSVTSDTLSTSIGGIPEGTWHLTVSAQDSSGAVRYRGTSDVYVTAGEVSRAVVYMNPVGGAGSVEVLVLWPGRPAVGHEFDLRFGERVSVEGTELTILFADVTEESRCPIPLMCFWAGNARIIMRANGSDVPLNTTVEPHHAKVGQYSIQLKLLRPYPHIDRPIPRAEYVARLLVTDDSGG
jgi:hypothetical protein